MLVGGGVATIRQYLQAKLIDEMHLAVAPVLLGSGEHFFADLDLPTLGYQCSVISVENTFLPRVSRTLSSRKRRYDIWVYQCCEGCEGQKGARLMVTQNKRHRSERRFTADT